MEFTVPRTYQVYDLTIAANSEVVINVQAEFFNVLDTSATDFLLALDMGIFNYAKKGHKARLPDGGMFKAIRLRNPSGASITVKIAAGFGDLIDSETQVSGFISLTVPSGLPSTPDVSINAASTIQVLAVNLNRKEAMISNLATNTQTMRISDSFTGAAQGTPVAPGQTITIEATAAIWAYNPGGVAESLAAVEIVAA